MAKDHTSLPTGKSKDSALGSETHTQVIKTDIESVIGSSLGTPRCKAWAPYMQEPFEQSLSKNKSQLGSAEGE